MRFCASSPESSEVLLLRHARSCFALFIALFLFASSAPIARAQALIEKLTVNGSVTIPRVSRPPTLEDFLSMKPHPDFADGRMAMVDKFRQHNPHDGEPSSQKTEVYLGYDQKNFYAVFVCFDTEPSKIRGHMAKREDAFGDENAEIMLDTFADQRRSYGFMSNPLGVQADGIWTEGQNWDMSWDAVWSSRGKITTQGYVVWMAIPFKTLRFPSRPQQSWGLMLNRDIPRNSEENFWPQYSNKVEGRLNQEGVMKGLENISPGRNMQFTPHSTLASYRAPDLRDLNNPRYERKDLKGEMGLDSKIVLKDALVLDATVKPDFSQVESDEPQTTANRRFETFYPEKRPFFIENASYFTTPINLVFTRRISDPDFGVRLSGKAGPYSIGMLFADDKSPGRILPDNDPLFDSRAYFNVVRVQRDISNQSTLGMIYTDREYNGAFNRVGGMDGRFKLNANWVSSFQVLTSSTRFDDGTTAAGPLYFAQIKRTARHFSMNTVFSDTSVGFVTQTGFFKRPDYRQFQQGFGYRWFPKKSIIDSHGLYSGFNRAYDHQGFRLNSWQYLEYNVNFKGQSFIDIGSGFGTEGLRPQDFSSLAANKQYSTANYFVYFESNHFQKIGFHASVERELAISYATLGIFDAPPIGQAPRRVHDDSMEVGTTIKPMSRLRIDNKYLFERLYDPKAGLSQLNTHVIRSKWNYQFNRELSLRFIGQYGANLANPALTYLQRAKGFNADFLMTYLLHPGTALYVGYNSNMANLDPNLAMNSNGEVIRRTRFVNDSRLVFVKLSYMFRY